MIKRTKSKTYLLPLIAQVLPLEEKFIPYIVNTFLKKEGFDEDGLYLHIQHRFNFKDPHFTKYERELMNSNLFICSEDVGEDVIYTFRFPEEYEHEYMSFINGKYSEFKEDAKKIILNFLSMVYSRNMQAVDFLVRVRRVLNKDERLRQEWVKKGIPIEEGSELESIVDIENETFKFENKKYELDGV